ncbi:Glycosyltransferase involved in cell wall bisynthesis [Catalinimonas alkaloidigena]|uniref:Glycosyltransferase involved in cell wall bisynthesis n=1 Tax=Catalinimonas alkaloidigena TaxID=1075417 RepID=A0A1G9MY59_9BACT|nr:glycosyltransferase family 1 protein [Catalinimonas alkaloidigena]SDL79159.1 Glycosyltransferase involved in cell wall bisynthesis [Catalinimonas alkaloidigena]
MRIGIEAQRLFRTHKQGMDVYALELIKHLQQMDQENEYFIFVKADADTSCLPDAYNFHIVEVQGRSYPDWEQYYLPKAALRHQLDVLHCTANTAPLRYHGNLVLTIHDVTYMEKESLKNDGSTAYQRAGSLYRRLVVPMVAPNASQVMTVSWFQRNCISQSLHLPTDQIEVVHNGVGHQFFQPTNQEKREQVRERYQLPTHYYFFLGNTEYRKNLTGVVQAYALLTQRRNDVPALVMKGIDEPFLTRTLAALGQPDLRERCRLIDYVDTEDLPTLYDMSEAFLFPSLSEGFGIPIIEAMASGTPVITSDTSAMPEIAGDAALLIDPYDPKSIADAMEELLDRPYLAEDLRSRGILRARHFSWRSTAERTLQIYQRFNPEDAAAPYEETLLHQ